MGDIIKQKTKHENFKEELLCISVSNIFESAVLEWEFDSCEDSKDIQIYNEIEQYFCLCTTKIRYLNNIKNNLNHQMTTVGSCCVKKFMKKNKDLDLVMNNIKTIKTKNDKYCEKKKLKKICKKCYKHFELKSIDEHKWKHQCLKCFIKYKDFEKNTETMSRINMDFEF